MRLLLFLFVALSTGVFAQEGYHNMKDKAKFKKDLAEKTASTTSIEASFKQEKFMSILSQQLVSSGTIQYKTPDKVRWSYDTPYIYNIILNGKEIIIDDNGKVNAFSVGSSKMFSEMNQLIVNSVQGNVLDETKFQITYLENDRYFLTKMVPLDKKQLGTYLSEIDVYFDKNDFSVAQLKLMEPEGDYTQISFVEKQFNINILDENFNK